MDEAPKLIVPDHLPKDVEIPDPFADGATPFEPFATGVLIAPENPEDRTKGGLILPIQAQKPMLRGLVVAVGEGAFTATGERCPMSAKVGDRVLLAAHIGSPLKIGGREYVLVNDRELLGRINDPKADVKNEENFVPRPPRFLG